MPVLILPEATIGNGHRCIPLEFPVSVLKQSWGAGPTLYQGFCLGSGARRAEA
jgi:hypothetical protein